MVNKKSKKTVKRKPVKKVDYWFRKRKGSKDLWGFIPINWKGSVSLFLLIVLNIFSANYFGRNLFLIDNWLKMGTVFFLSMLIFILIAREKTRMQDG